MVFLDAGYQCLVVISKLEIAIYFLFNLTFATLIYRNLNIIFSTDLYRNNGIFRKC